MYCDLISFLHCHLPGCGADFQGESGEFTSPNYPQPYPRYKECIWKIEVPYGKRIQLNILDIDVETSANCKDDFIEVQPVQLH